MTIQTAVEKFKNLDFCDCTGEFSNNIYCDAVKNILNAITYGNYELCNVDYLMDELDNNAQEVLNDGTQPKVLTVEKVKSIVKEACK